MSFEPVNSPFYAQHAALPLGATPVYQQPTQPNYNPFNMQPTNNMANMKPVNGIQQLAQPKMVDPRQFETPQIVSSGSSMFKFKAQPSSIHVDVEPSDIEAEKKKSPGRPKKVESGNVPIVTGEEKPANQVNGQVIENPTAYTYMETTGMLRETLGQIDTLNSELMQEFQMVRNNRTMKNKYNVLVGLSENVGSLIGNKISAIREINSSISKSNELDYKKLKDIKSAQAALDDDKYIADLYKSVMAQPNMAPVAPVFPQVDASIFGSGVVRAQTPFEMNNGMAVDTSYLNYQSRLTPEQNSWRFEDNPAVQQVLVMDDATGNKFFQYMNTQTGEVIPNMPTYDENIVADCTVDRDRMVAKNTNLNQIFPLVIINQGVQSAY
jgi:hypothetical protein